MKKCYCCKKNKNESLFNKDSSKKDGLYPVCSECRMSRIGRTTERRWRRDWTLDSNGYLSWKGYRQHRVLMEKFLGRKLKKWEHVHHINEIKTDNRIENLTILSDRDHHSLHSKEYWSKHREGGLVKCFSCGKEKYLPKSSYFMKRKIYQCASCYYESGGATGRSRL